MRWLRAVRDWWVDVCMWLDNDEWPDVTLCPPGECALCDADRAGRARR